MIKFSDEFYFGSATSATQTEGASNRDGKGENIWDYWYAKNPHRFFNEVGPSVTSTFYDNYKEDIALLKKTGRNSFRFSISWSRLIPTGYGEVNQKAVEFYHRVIDELIRHDIVPFVSLFHFDMPLCLQELGGFENRQVVTYYQEYAKVCFELFGHKVKNWFTFNEPIVPVECGYLYGGHYPEKYDFQAATQVAYHTILASALAISEYKKLKFNGKIGIVLNLSPCYPRSEHPADIKAARYADLFFNKSFLDPSVHGTFPKMLSKILKKHHINIADEHHDLEVIKNNTVNFLGVNYYQPRRVCAKAVLPNPDAPFEPGYYFDHYHFPGRKMNPYRGWEIYEKGIYDIAINIRDEYKNIEWMITENGMGVEGEDRFLEDGMIIDDYRIEFYKDHLRWLHRGIEEGSNCIGYHVWTFIDNWSWLNAYKNRYGLVSLDLKTQSKTIKKSGYWFKSLATQKGFE